MIEINSSYNKSWCISKHHFATQHWPRFGSNIMQLNIFTPNNTYNLNESQFLYLLARAHPKFSDGNRYLVLSVDAPTNPVALTHQEWAFILKNISYMLK
jgi:hypothetical protein